MAQVGSVDGSGERDDDFRGVSVGGGEVDGALREMAGAEIALNATAPGADEGEIQNAADYGTG